MKDARGREVMVSDTLAVAFRQNNRAIIRMGRVVEIIPRQGYFGERITVKWEVIGGHRPESDETTIEPEPSRILVIG